MPNGAVAVAADHEATQVRRVEFAQLTQLAQVTKCVPLSGRIVPAVVAVSIDAPVQLDRFRRQGKLEGLLGVEMDRVVVPGPAA